MQRVLAFAILIGVAIGAVAFAVLLYLDYYRLNIDKGRMAAALVQLDPKNKCRIYIITDTRIMGLPDRYLKAIIEECK